MAIISTRGQGAFSRLPETLLNIMVQKEELAQAKEKQKIEQADFEMRQEAFQFDKLQRQESRTAAEGRVNQILRAAQAGDPQALAVINQSPLGSAARGGNADLISQLTQGLGARGPSGQAAPIEQIQEQVRLKSLKEDVIKRAGAQGENLRLALDAEEVGATVTQQDALADPVGTAARLRATNTASRLNAANAGLAEEKLKRPDNQALSSAFTIYKDTGVRWGQALAEVGLTPIEGGIDPNSVFVDPEKSATANAEATKQAGFYVQMTDSNNEINRLVAKTGGITRLASFRRAITPDGFISQAAVIAMNSFMDADQQSLVQAQLNFSNLYRFSLSGQQSSAVEAVRMQVVIAEEVNDSDLVKAAKRRTREIMIDVTRMRAEGAITRTQGMQIIIDRSTSLPPEAQAVLRAQLADATAADAIEAAGGQVFTFVSSDPSTPETVVDDVAQIDNFLDSLQRSN